MVRIAAGIARDCSVTLNFQAADKISVTGISAVRAEQVERLQEAEM